MSSDDFEDFDMEVVETDELDELGADGASSSEEDSQPETFRVEEEREVAAEGMDSSAESDGPDDSRSNRSAVDFTTDEDGFRVVNLNPVRIKVPEEWEVRSVDRLSSLVTDGAHQTPDYQESGVRFLSTKNLKPGRGSFDFSDYEKFISRDEHEELCERVSPQKGDLLLSKSGTIGICQLVRTDLEFSIFVGLALIRPSSEIHRPFMEQVLNWSAIRRTMRSRSPGSTRATLPIFALKDLEIPTPPLPEQRKIASVLYTVDQAIQKTEAIIEQAQRVKRGLMQKVFACGIDSGDNIRDPEVSPEDFMSLDLGGFEERLFEQDRIPESWNYHSLEDCLAEFVSGAAISSSEFTEQGFPVVAKGDVTDNEVIDLRSERQYVSVDTARKYSNSVVDSSYVVVSLRDLVPSAPTVGSASFVDADGQFLLAQGAYGLRLDENKLDPNFFVTLTRCHYFRSYMKRMAVGSTQVHVRSSEYKAMHIPLPPIEEQRRISSYFSLIDEHIRNAQSRVLYFKRLKRGLMQDLLTGEVRTADKAIDVLEEVEAHG
jgi:type I restriction enzyme S subunit